MQAINKPQSWGSRGIVHIEIMLKDDGISPDLISEAVTLWLRGNHEILYLDDDFKRPYHTPYHASVESICVAEFVGLSASLTHCQLSDVDLEVHPYRLVGEPKRPSIRRCTQLGEEIEEGAGNDGEASRFSLKSLPSRSFVSLWEKLIYDPPIKSSLLHYITSIILFSNLKVDTEIISCNRLVFLHGPPGTGKSSLCRALAQKISIRMRKVFSHTKLVEINCQSLFSKWLGGSGHLVAKIFSDVESLINGDGKCFICVFIDEIESLTSTRESAVSGNEPLDSMRATNAVLTALDRLRSRPNVVFLCTSNLAKAMDSAFLDRVDIKQFIPEPSASAVYSILRTCLTELQRCGIVRPLEQKLSLSDKLNGIGHNDASAGYSSHVNRGQSHAPEQEERRNMEQEIPSLTMSSTIVTPAVNSLPSPEDSATGGRGDSDTDMIDSAEPLATCDLEIPNIYQARLDRKVNPNGIGARLLEIAESCEGISARTLRRMPLVAHALYVQRETCTIDVFLHALARSVEDELKQKSYVGGGH